MVLPWLVRIFQGCVALGHVPLAWRPVGAPRVLYGPLPGALSRPPSLRERQEEHGRQGCSLPSIRGHYRVPLHEVLYRTHHSLPP